jgi:hypothetical protein
MPELPHRHHHRIEAAAAGQRALAALIGRTRYMRMTIIGDSGTYSIIRLDRL